MENERWAKTYAAVMDVDVSQYIRCDTFGAGSEYHTQADIDRLAKAEPGSLDEEARNDFITFRDAGNIFWCYRVTANDIWDQGIREVPPLDANAIFDVLLPRLQADGWNFGCYFSEAGRNEVVAKEVNKPWRRGNSDGATAHEACAEAIAQAMQVAEE